MIAAKKPVSGQPDRKVSPANKAHTESVLLTFWGQPCTATSKNQRKTKPLTWHWSDTPPTMREIEVACVGALVGRSMEEFEVHGILPQGIMPTMSEKEQRDFMAALEKKLGRQCAVMVRPFKKDLVDWEGVNKIV